MTTTGPRRRNPWKINQQKATYRKLHPERWAAYQQAMSDPQPCDTCGGEGRPWLHPETFVVQAWRCYACRKGA